MTDESKLKRISREPLYRLKNNTASYLFNDEVCVWVENGVLKIGAFVHSDDGNSHSNPEMTALSFSLKEATRLANTIIETLYIFREDRAQKYMELIRAEAEKLDPETCHIFRVRSSIFDPYDLHVHRIAFLQQDQTDRDIWVRNQGSEISINERDIPKTKLSRIMERLIEQEERDSKLNNDDDFDDWYLPEEETVKKSKGPFWPDDGW